MFFFNDVSVAISFHVKKGEGIARNLNVLRSVASARKPLICSAVILRVTSTSNRDYLHIRSSSLQETVNFCNRIPK